MKCKGIAGKIFGHNFQMKTLYSLKEYKHKSVDLTTQRIHITPAVECKRCSHQKVIGETYPFLSGWEMS